MPLKMVVRCFMILLVCSISTTVLSQGVREDRMEGRVVFSNKGKSTLAVRTVSGTGQRVIHYDASTKWVSQYHGEKKVNTIDASQVKDGDYVICVGSIDDKGEFHASTISKRLTHSPE
jgi:hypothetical protein